jgi:hypothetical protein
MFPTKVWLDELYFSHPLDGPNCCRGTYRIWRPMHLPPLLQLSGRFLFASVSLDLTPPVTCRCKLTIVFSQSRVNRRCKHYTPICRCGRISAVLKADVRKIRSAMGGHSTRLLGCNYDPHSSRLPSLWTITETKEPLGAMNP